MPVSSSCAGGSDVHRLGLSEGTKGVAGVEKFFMLQSVVQRMIADTDTALTSSLSVTPIPLIITVR